MEKTANLFDADSPMFRNAIYTCVGLVGVLTVLGLIWEFAYWRPRQPKEKKTGKMQTTIRASNNNNSRNSDDKNDNNA